MYKLLFGSILLLLVAPASQAQTPAENLEKGVEQYNAMKEYVSGLNPKTLTADEVDAARSRTEKGVALLEKTIREGTAEQIKVARYFRANFKYQYVFALGMKGENVKALPVLKEIETDMTALSQSDFPLRYGYFGKNYIIKWEDFAPTQGEFYASYGEIAYNTSNYTDAARLSRRALEHPNANNWLKYIAVNKLLDIDKKGAVPFTKAERRDAALRSLQLYDAVGEDSRKTIKENNYPTVLRGTEILLDLAKQDASQPFLQAAAEGAQIGGKYRPEGLPNLSALYELLYRNNYKGNNDFHQAALAYAKSAYANEKTTTKSIGQSALAALAAQVTTSNCADFRKYADEYRFFGNVLETQKLETRARQCEADRAAEEKRQAEIRRKEEEAARRRARRANRYFNIYIGFEPFPAMVKADYVDLSGHIDLRGRRVAHSFGYAKIKRKRDVYSAGERWDGTRAYYALKIFGKDTDKQVAYTGLYFGYADKTFSPLGAQITPKDPSSGTLAYADVTPTDKQYELLWNNGMQVLGKGVGLDFWFGIGAAYHQLSFPEYDIEKYDFTGHEFFETRKKVESIGLRLRLGLSVGLNLGRKRT